MGVISVNVTPSLDEHGKFVVDIDGFEVEVANAQECLRWARGIRTALTMRDNHAALQERDRVRLAVPVGGRCVGD